MSEPHAPSAQTLGIRLGVISARTLGALGVGGHGASALDAPLSPLSPRGELSIARIADPALVLGAFQRRTARDALPSDPRPFVRRISGGPIVEVGPGTIHVLLSLAHPAAFIPADAPRLVNRYVRPLLSALTKLGQKANYFGRDWISVAKSPVAWAGFAHDATTGRAAFEAFVSITTPFATGPRSTRASFLGKPPTTLEEVLARRIDLDALMEKIAHAYAKSYSCARTDLGPWRSSDEPDAEPNAPDGDIPIDPPWAATTEEPIGTIAAGPDARGIFRVGGDLLASRDAILRLERTLANLDANVFDAHAVHALVDAAFTAPHVALEGVRTLAHLTDVILRARTPP